MFMTLLGTLMLVRLEQPENARSPILGTLMPSETLVKLRQSVNELAPMLTTLLLIMRLVKVAHSAKALLPMLVTLSGIMTLVKVEYENADPAMLTIGKPLVIAGMTTMLFVPVYPVMGIAPLLVVNVDCACPTAGSSSTAPSKQS